MELDREKKIHLLFSFFRLHPLTVVGTVSNENVPELASVYTYITEDLAVYFVTKTSTRKFSNLIENSPITLFAFDENVLTCAEISGTALILGLGDEHGVVTEELRKIIESRKSQPYVPPVDQLEEGQLIIFKVTPVVARLSNYVSTTELTEDLKPLSFEVPFNK